jgi:predicted nucleic acid-binding Zn ribbon protein
MSLESCVACGHALAIADHRCRHCSPASFGTQRRVKGIELHLLIALAALVLTVLIYLVFLR